MMCWESDELGLNCAWIVWQVAEGQQQLRCVLSWPLFFWPQVMLCNTGTL